KVELLAEQGNQMKVVDSQQLQVSEDGAQQRFELSYIPELPGETKISVRAVPQPGELVQHNNLATTYVTVLKGGVKVLYLEGRPRAEQKYLRWALGASPNVHVDFRELD